ncbi:hypothetical protein SBA5_350005 [Candidatus Sulfotelmatomonas gaucii]|uniref:Uncharacterized protein n=1 Tax=Candidatus Sulfuritelmatomonas gaucii TaxID=2043161 RepID=A0A2N9LH82_9BACT|nr:hypothetical protein SBA5_350005 [Candidatus Sulfotelmatomonas gaucii]
MEMARELQSFIQNQMYIRVGVV